MSGPGDVGSALISALKQDAGVRARFGDQARIYDEEPVGGIYPYAYIQTLEEAQSGGAERPGTTHRVSLVVRSRHGGRAEARTLLGVLQSAAEHAELTLNGHRVVLALATYSDVLRAPNLRSFRGLLRLRIVTEEIV